MVTVKALSVKLFFMPLKCQLVMWLLSLKHLLENSPDEFLMVSYRPVFFDRKSEREFNEKVTLFWIKYPRCLGFLWLWSRNNLILRLFYRKVKWNNKNVWIEHTWFNFVLFIPGIPAAVDIPAPTKTSIFLYWFNRVKNSSNRPVG